MTDKLMWAPEGLDDITAKEAAQLADESIFNRIKDAIREAANLGEFKAEVPYINPRHKAKLEEQGYKIEESENKVGKKFIINFPLPE